MENNDKEKNPHWQMFIEEAKTNVHVANMSFEQWYQDKLKGFNTMVEIDSFVNMGKAKKILFGTEFFNQQGIGSKLPDNPEAKMNEEALKRKDHFSKYTGSLFFKPAKGDDENELEQFEQPDSQNAASQKPDEDELQMFIDYHLWPKEWFNKMVAYCREHKISPVDLIEQHEYLCKMNHRMLKEAIKNARGK